MALSLSWVGGLAALSCLARSKPGGEVGVLGRDGRRVAGAERLIGPISIIGSEGTLVSNSSLDCMAKGVLVGACGAWYAKEKSDRLSRRSRNLGSWESELRHASTSTRVMNRR